MEQLPAKRRRAGRLGGEHSLAAAETATEEVVPLLVRVLAGNSVTSITVLACLNTVDARHARRLHPAVAGAVAAAIPWCDTDTRVVDPVRWRAVLPAAVGARLAGRALESLVGRELAPAALSGITHLNLQCCIFISDELLLRLPVSLRVMNVRQCRRLTERASFAHLTALTSLNCSQTMVVSERTDGLPPSLQELEMQNVRVHASLAHLRQLRMLRADGCILLDAALLASLPPSLEELYAEGCKELTPAASFAHLTALRKLDITYTTIGDASLASVPPSLLFLTVRGCYGLTPAAVLPRLPALLLLDVSGTDIGNALVASLPVSLVELQLAGCRRVTAAARLDHLHALRQLHCIDTELAPAALAACRDRGCAVPAAVALRGYTERSAMAFALLGDGRLASRDLDGKVQLWDVAAGCEAAAAVPRVGEVVCALVALRDGRHLAIGTTPWGRDVGCVQVWDMGGVSPTRRATINYSSGVWSLAVLPDGRLAAGCGDCIVWVLDVDEFAVVAELSGHTERVTRLAVLPYGTLASGSDDATVRVWDVGARACVATLRGHTGQVACLAVLTDGRLASGAVNDGVRLWDVGARTCVGMLAGYATALAALPDGRLASGSWDGTIRLWDTRPPAAAGASRAVGAVPSEVVGVISKGCPVALLSLPDGRLACSGGISSLGVVYLLELPPPAALYE